MAYKDVAGNVVLPNESGTTDPRLTAPPATAPKSMRQVDLPLTVFDKRRSKREMSRPAIERSPRSRR